MRYIIPVFALLSVCVLAVEGGVMPKEVFCQELAAVTAAAEFSPHCESVFLRRNMFKRESIVEKGGRKIGCPAAVAGIFRAPGSSFHGKVAPGETVPHSRQETKP